MCVGVGSTGSSLFRVGCSLYLCSSDSLRFRAGGTKGGGPGQKRAVPTLALPTVVLGRGGTRRERTPCRRAGPRTRRKRPRAAASLKSPYRCSMAASPRVVPVRSKRMMARRQRGDWGTGRACSSGSEREMGEGEWFVGVRECVDLERPCLGACSLGEHA